MPVIRIDAGKLERIAALYLRDELKVLPSKANEAASGIASRLMAAMPDPHAMPLRDYRLIGPDAGDDFSEVLSAFFQREIDDREARQLWKLIYKRGREVPSDVAGSLDGWLRGGA